MTGDAVRMWVSVSNNITSLSVHCVQRSSNTSQLEDIHYSMPTYTSEIDARRRKRRSACAIASGAGE